MKIEVEVKIPMVPNYITAGTQQLDVKDFSDEQLREIGKLWTERLVEHAAKRRAVPLPVARGGGNDGSED